MFTRRGYLDPPAADRATSHLRGRGAATPAAVVFPARAALEIERGLQVDERERDELGDPAGPLLDAAQDEQVAGPRVVALDVAEHDRAGRPEADPMGGLDHLGPLGGAQWRNSASLSRLICQLADLLREHSLGGFRRTRHSARENLADAGRSCPTLGDAVGHADAAEGSPGDDEVR